MLRQAASSLGESRPLVEMGIVLADHGQVERAFADVRGYSGQIFGTADYRGTLAAELAVQGRIDDLRRAAATGHRSAQAYLTALLAAEYSAADPGQAGGQR